MPALAHQCEARTNAQENEGLQHSPASYTTQLTDKHCGVKVLTGLCASSAHWKQKAAPHLQLMSSGSPPTSALASMAFSHPAAIAQY